jgi:RNA polymerase sigma-70 factor (subfamily 1)
MQAFLIEMVPYQRGQLLIAANRAMDSDADINRLIHRAQTGDTDAKMELLNHFRPYLALLTELHVQPILQSKFDTSDVIQETCLQAIESFDQFRGTDERQLMAWLRQITARKAAWMARQYLATGNRNVQLEQRIQHDLDQSSIDIANLLPGRRSSPSMAAMRRERAVLLADAIAQVSPEQRRVLIMHGLQGVAIAEAAKALQKSEAATWKLWARGLKSLQQLLKDNL